MTNDGLIGGDTGTSASLGEEESPMHGVMEPLWKTSTEHMLHDDVEVIQLTRRGQEQVQ